MPRTTGKKGIKIIARHHEGSVGLDEPSFKLFELAKRIYHTREDDEKGLQTVLTDLANFNKQAKEGDLK